MYRKYENIMAAMPTSIKYLPNEEFNVLKEKFMEILGANVEFQHLTQLKDGRFPNQIGWDRNRNPFITTGWYGEVKSEPSTSSMTGRTTPSYVGNKDVYQIIWLEDLCLV